MDRNSTTSNEFHGSCLLTTYLKQSPTREIIFTNTVKCTVDSFIAVITIVNNYFFIRAYTKFPQLHCISYRLLLHLAINDFLVGALAVPLYVVRGIMELYGKHNCVFFNIERFSILFLLSLSFFLLLLVSCERFIAVIYPIKYSVLCTQQRVSVWFIVTLTSCLLFILLFIWSMPLYYTFVGVVVCITIAQIITIYCKIYRVALNQRKRILRERATFYCGAMNNKAERTTAYILMFMLLCYAPGLVYVLYTFTVKSSVYSRYIHSPWFEMLIFLNSSCNPFIYYWRIRRIRQSVISLLPSIPCLKHSRVDPNRDLWKTGSSTCKIDSSIRSTLYPYTDNMSRQ